MNKLVGLLYRAATLLLPTQFRRRNASELDTLHREALDRAAARGMWTWLRAVVCSLWDVVKEAVRSRTAGRRYSHRSSSRQTNAMESTLQDIRLAARSLLKSRGFTFTAVAMITLGIGANTSLFSVVNAALLRGPQHVESPERLVSVYTSDFSGPAFGGSSLPDFNDFREQTPAFVDAFALQPGAVSIPNEEGASDRLVTEFVSGNYFELLGVPMATGRTFSSEESDPRSGAAVVVLSHGLWTRQFGADPNVMGRSLRVSGQTLTIVGVAPEGFGGVIPLVTPELWIPLSSYALIAGVSDIEQRGSRGWFVVGRLADAATAERAQEQLTALASRLRGAYPQAWMDVNDATRRVTVVPGVGLPPPVRGVAVGFAALLLGVFVVTLLIACANLANVTLTRASRRRREVAMKVALGASRVRILRQLLAESTIVGLLGGIAGTLLGLWLIGAVRTLPPIAGVELALDLGPDRRLLLFSTFLTLLTVVAVGLVPAVKASRADLSHALKGDRADASGRFRLFELRNLLVIGQVAASLVLLVGAGLMLKSVRAATRIDPGFAVEGVATLSLSLGPEGYTGAETHGILEQLADRVARLPGVESVSYTDALPMTPGAFQRRGVSIPGYEPGPGEDMEFQFHAVGPGFADALEMEVIRGRDVTREDNEAAPRVVLVNESFAQRFWPGEDPLTRVVNSGGPAQVVGVMRDALYRTLQDEGRPAFFMPVAQNPSATLTLIARTSRDAEGLLPMLRSEVAQLDDRLPVATLQTMEDAISLVLLPQRIASLFLSIAGVLGMLLAAAGLYGVVTLVVSQKTREIGIRMALGAQARDVVGRIVRQGVAVSAVGAVIGLGIAALATRLVQGFLFNVRPLDAGVFSGMALAALVVAGFASWVPARRASNVDPMVALRLE